MKKVTIEKISGIQKLFKRLFNDRGSDIRLLGIADRFVHIGVTPQGISDMDRMYGQHKHAAKTAFSEYKEIYLMVNGVRFVALI